MNFTIQADVQQAATVVFDSGLLVASCTIQVPLGGQTASGAPNNQWTPVTGLEDLACMCSVPSANAVQATEFKALAEIMAKSVRHVLLGGYYPNLKRLKQAGQVQALLTLPDGNSYAYEVLGAEDDSQGTMTRFECQLVTT